MAFLTPLFLLGLLAAAIPIAIHLIRKEKPPKMVFSSLRFLKNTSKKLILFQKIQQWLLLLLRAGLIALLVFAFARPLFDSSISSLVDAEPESAVILLDASMSMRYGNRFERAKQEAIDLIADMSAGDEIAVIAFDNAAVSVRELSSDLDGARAFIEGLAEPGYEVTRYMPALRLANDLLESSRYERRQIHLVSDYQASGMGSDDSGWLLSPGVALNPIDVGEGATRNLLLTDVRSPDQLIENQNEYEILARVRSSGNVHLDSAEVRLVLDGVESARVQVDLEDTSEAVVRLPAIFDTAGTHRGEIRVASDDFSVDNSYFFTVDVTPKIQVLVVNGEPSSNWYEDEAHWMNLAIGAAAESPFVLNTVSSREFSPSTLEQQDVVVLLNAGSDLSTTQTAALHDYVSGGGSLLLAPGDRVVAAQFNQLFADLSPATLRESIRFTGSDYLLIADIDRRHPVLLPLGGEWGVRFEGYWAVDAAPDADVLMQFDNSSPAFLERAYGQGNVLMFASSLDTEWNNLPLQGLFLPFIHESIRYLAQASTKERAYRIGNLIDLSDISANAAITVMGPSGEALRLNQGGNSLMPEVVGFLTVEGPQTPLYYAVNANPEESNLERMAPSALHDQIINPETAPTQSLQVRTNELMNEIEGPQRVWWWILLFVMGLLLLETRIANTTHR
ncbi:MAG: BatA domain-containing protein [Gammaproteobacteria bacterium]